MPAAPPTWAETEDIPSWSETTEIVEERPLRGESSDFVEPPPRPQFDMAEFTRGDVATPEQQAFNSAQPKFDPFEPLVKLPQITGQISQDALDMLQASMMRLGAPRPSAEIEAAALELEQRASVPPTPLAQTIAGGVNVAKTIPETFTSPVGIATLGAGILPKIGQRAVSAAFLADMAAHTPEAAARAGEASVTGDIQEQVEAYGSLGLTPLMATAVGLHAFGPGIRPPIPPRIIETIAKADAVGLTRSAQALADTVKRNEVSKSEGNATLPSESIVSDRPQQLEVPIEKGIPDAIQEPPAAEGVLRQERPEVELQEVRQPQAEIVDAVPPEPARAPGGEEGQILLTRLLDAAKNGKSAEGASGNAREFGKTLTTPEEIAALKAEHAINESEYAQALESLGPNPTDAQITPVMLEHGLKGQYINEAIDGATGAWEFKTGPNKDVPKFRALREGGQPINEKSRAAEGAATGAKPIPARQAPVVEPGVGAVPENVPVAANSKVTQYLNAQDKAGKPVGRFANALDNIRKAASDNTISDDLSALFTAAGVEHPFPLTQPKEWLQFVADFANASESKTLKAPAIEAAQKGLAAKILDREVEYKGEVTSPRRIVDGERERGAIPIKKEVPDNTRYGVLQKRYEALKNNYPLGNPNHPLTIEFRKVSAELEAGPKKTKYYMERPDGSLMPLNKTEFEYAARKPAQPLPEPAGQIKAGGEQPTPAETQAVPSAKPALASAESKLAEVVNQTIEQSSPTRLGVSPAATMRPMDVVLGAPDLRSISTVVEARWQQAVKGTEGIIDKVKTQAGEAWKSITREYADLPPREFPAEIDVLRRLRASRNASARTAVDVLKGITNNLGPKQYGVFNRVALLEDLVKDVEAGKYAAGQDLPFGYQNAGELTADLNKFRSVAEATPQIKAALQRRQEFMDSLRSTLVERGFLPESILQDPRYFHHQVLLYMAEKNAPSGSRSFRDWFSGWQKKRTGSSKDYNRQYVEAEAEVLSDAFNKIAMQDLQAEMRGIADLTAQLKELHGAEWRQHIPKTHTEWQPKRGNAFYPVQTVAEQVMDRYLSGLGDILPSEFKEALAVGGRRQEWVVPKPLAKVLDNIAPRLDNWIGRLATTAQNSWKRYILLNPLRAAKYNLNNLSGDLDFLFAAQPKIFKEFKSSANDMWGFHVKGKSAVGDIKDAMQDGVIGSGWRASELPDIARSDYFNWLTGEKPKLVDRYWNWIGKRSDAREDTGRLASYRFAKKEWEAGRPFYGASVPADVNALATPRLKAAKVAREILIDYGRGTEFSNFTRQKLVPFFKWMEGNFVRYQQLIKNIPEQEGAGPRVAGVAGKKAATLGLRMAAAYGIVNLWNHMFFPKEEEELGEGRNQLHLILGRDEQGNIQTVRFQGALSDLLGWVGMENLPQDVEDLATGKADVGDKMQDAYEAGISRAVNASLPFPKTAAEIGLGRSFYPNALQPRPVRDKAEHAAGLFSLKPVYQWLAGKPHKPLRQEIANLISYTTDPGEAAYNTTRHMAGEWLEEHGEERASVIPGKRSNALYYYKQALRYKDQETAKKFLDEYNKLGGKREGLSQSIKASAPLSMLGDKRKAFLDSLSPQEQEAVKRAEEWYRRVYARPPTPNPNP